MAIDLAPVARLAGSSDNLAVLATTRPDGSVHASVVNAGVLTDPVSGEQSIGVVVAGDAAKLRHLRRTHRATAVFRSGWQWVAVDGPVRIVGPDDEADGFTGDRLRLLLREIFVAAGGTHDDWDEYDRVMAAERRTAVFIEPARVSGQPRV
jgi:PPOX class probable F420-dependent enzyme